MEIKNKIKKLFLGLLAVFTIVASGGVTANTAVYAEAPATTEPRVDWGGEKMKVTVSGRWTDHTGHIYTGFFGEEPAIRDANTGQFMYCVEAGVIMEENTHTSVGSLQSVYGKTTGDKAQLIAYYGSQNGSYAYTFAAQILIWETLNGASVSVTSSNASAINAAKADITNKVNAFLASGREVRGTSHVYRSSGQDVMTTGTLILDKDVSAELNKVSAEVNFSASNSAYSLAGAKYNVYEGNGTSGKLLTTLTTDANGKASANSLSVDADTAYLTFVEIEAPKGYVLDTTPIVVALSNNKAVCNVTEDLEKQSIQVEINKTSSEPAVTDGNASYSLAGAKYKVYYFDQYGQPVELGTLTTNATGKASATYNNLPLGISELKAVEIEAPTGFNVDTTEHVQSLVAGINAFNVSDTPKKQDISVELNKSSSNPDMTNGNSCYSLEGAEYQISYLGIDGNYVVLGTLTTDVNGHASATYTGIPLGVTKLKAVETKASYHYQLDTSENITVINGTSAVFNVKETPLSDPGQIEIIKTDAEDRTSMPDLSGAEFTFKYYDTMDVYSAEDLANLTPTRTWVFKTVEIFGRYMVSVSLDNCFVGGDDLYRNSSGKVTFPFGVLTIQETKAATGYTISGGSVNSKNETISAGADDIVFFRISETNSIEGLTYDNPFTKQEESIRGGFSVTKVDNLTDRRPQGDASFAGAQFDLIYVDNPDEPGKGITVVADVNGNGKFDSDEEFAPGEKITTIILDGNGQYSSADDFLNYGKYKLVESKTPTGYSACTDIEFTISENKVIVPLTATEVVYDGDIQIHKTFSSGESSWVQNEEGAVFDIVAAKYVRLYADDPNHITRDDVLRAYDMRSQYTGTDVDGAPVSEFTSKEFDQITTNANGTAKSKKLAYGEYYMIQVSGKHNYDVIPDPVKFSISSEHQKTLYFEASNTPKKFVLKMIKKDDLTGSAITYNSAAFKVKMLEDADGNDMSNVTDLKLGLANGYVTQIVGDGRDKTIYDTFKTVSTNAVNEKLEAGMFYPANTNEDYETQASTVAAPLELFPGKYVLEEVVTPDGFTTGSEIEFIIDEDNITLVNEYNQNIVEVTEYDNPLMGEFTIVKTLDEYEGADKSFVEHDLTQFGFTLYAKEDIINPDDGSILVKAGDEAVAYVEHAKPLSLRTAGCYVTIGEQFADEDGYVHFSNLPLGTYVLKETTQPDGTVKNDHEYEIIVEQTAFDKTINAEPVTENDYRVMIDRNVVTDPSNKKFVDFKIDNYVTKTELVKTDITGTNEMPGAVMQVLDKDSNVVVEWTSTNKSYKIEGLKDGETYTLHEQSAPEGYVLRVSDVEFTVEGKDIKSVSMENKYYSLTKVDVAGDELPGAVMAVYEVDEDGNDISEEPVDTWTSTDEKHLIRNLVEGHSYRIHEQETPEGYVQAADILFTADEDFTENHEYKMIDKKVTVSKNDPTGEPVEGAHIQVINADGNVVDEWDSETAPHAVRNLTVGNAYTIHEESVPAGYYFTADIEITVEDSNEDQAFEMIDKPIIYEIAKVDEDGNPVAGVTLTLMDITDPENPVAVELPNEGVTTDEPFVLDKVLMPEHDYELTETDLIGGVYRATSIQFTVPKYSESEKFTITMTDELTGVNVAKVDDTGRYVPGAKMHIEEIADDSGNEIEPVVVYEFESENKPIDVSAYVKGGYTYRLVEDEVPFGYDALTETVTDEEGNEVEVPKTVEFTVDGTDEEVQLIDYVNNRKHFYVSAVKVDANDDKTLLKGAEITVYNKADDTIAKDVNGKDAVGITDGKGNYVFEMPYSHEGYYVMETGAPEGYSLNENKFDVELTEDYDFAKENPIVIKVADSLLPSEESKTGVFGKNPLVYGGIAVAGVAIATGALIASKKKKEDKSEKE